MKPFNLEAAKNGAKLCTRDGRPARIICYDRKGSEYSIIALVNMGGSELMESYDANGKYCNIKHDLDLFLVPTKHEGWVNIFESHDIRTAGAIYDTKEKAQKSPLRERTIIDTIHIEWEE